LTQATALLTSFDILSGYAIGNALRNVIVGKRRTRSDRPHEKETPEESFRKLAEQNKDLFGGRDGPKKE